MEVSVAEKQDLAHIQRLFGQLKAASIEFKKEPIGNRVKRLNTLRTWIKLKHTKAFILRIPVLLTMNYGRRT